MSDYALQNLPDGTTNPAWVAARRGCLSASRIADILKSGRGGKPSETRLSYAKQLAAERLTGHACGHVSPLNPDIRRGLECEPIALAEYEILRGVMLDPPAWRTHPTIEHAGATPDAVIPGEGLAQVKCPRVDKMVSFMLAGEFPQEYEPQMAWELACCPFVQWNDLVVYSPDMPQGRQLWIKRLMRDDERIAYLEEQARAFLAEVETIFEVISTMEQN